MDPPPDLIEIRELEISARIGVPDDERATTQRLTVSVVLQPRHAFAELRDELARTVDYAAVCDALQQLASRSEVRLIETLADALAAHLLTHFPVRRVELELRKFILPQTKFVAVRVTRMTTDIAEN